jgi:hypothetical protein
VKHVFGTRKDDFERGRIHVISSKHYVELKVP